MPTDAPPQYSRWRFTAEGFLWMLCVGVMLTAGLLKTINLLVLVGYLMLSLVLLNAWLAWRSAHRVRLTRGTTMPVFARQPATRAVLVTNTADKGASVTVFERSDAHTVEVFVPALVPDETRRISANFVPEVRGKFVTTPLSILAGYPFGLVEYRHPIEHADTLIVLPALGQVDLNKLRRWLIRTGTGDNRARRPLRRPSMQSADVRGVKAYRPGDSPRDIHWRTTARRNELMVREYDSTEPLDLLLIVEPWQPLNPSADDRLRVEACLSLASSIFWAWCHSDETPEATLAIAGTDRIRTGRATDGFGRAALTLCADVEASPATATLPAQTLTLRTNRCVRILVSSRANSSLASELRSRSGLPFICLDATGPMAWYVPPTSPKTGA